MTLGIVLAVSNTSATNAVEPIAMASSEVRTNPSTREMMVPAAMSAEAFAARERDREASLGSGLACSAWGVWVICFVYDVSQIVPPKVWESSAALVPGKLTPRAHARGNLWVGYQAAGRVAWPWPVFEPVHRV